jgi:hypothetical protein
MNPQDSEQDPVLDFANVPDEDLGIYVFSDSELIEIEKILKFCKYCLITTTIGIGIGITIYIIKKYK